MNAAKEPELWTELLRLGAAFGRRMLEERNGPSSPQGHGMLSSRPPPYAPKGPPAAPYPRALTAQPCPLAQGTPDPPELRVPRPSTEDQACPIHTGNPSATCASSADRDGLTSPGRPAYGPARRRSRSLRWRPSALPQRSGVPRSVAPPARPLSFEELCSRVHAL